MSLGDPERPAEPDPDDEFIKRANQLNELANRIIDAGRRIKSALDEEELFMDCQTAKVVRETDSALFVLDRIGTEVRIALDMLVRAARRARR